MIFLPLLFQLLSYIIFVFILYRKQRFGYIYDLGFFFSTIFNTYTIICFLNLAINDFSPTMNDFDITKINRFNYDLDDITAHFYRIFLYILSFQFFYIIFGSNCNKNINLHFKKSFKLELILFFILFLTVLFLFSNSNQGDSYSEVYKQFDSLSPFAIKIIQFLLGAKQCIYIIFFLYLYSSSASQVKILSYLLLFLAYEFWFHQGARINILYLILINFVLFNIYKKPIRMSIFYISLGIMVISSGVVEAFRSNGFQLINSIDYIRENGLLFSYEFGSLFDSSFHLYHQRDEDLIDGSLLLSLNDFISLIPFINHTEYSPIHWYAREYYPGFEVPPVTMGPLAESAINFGAVELPFRAMILAFFYAMTKKFFTRKDTFFSYLLYLFIFATIPFGFKQTMLFQYVSFLKNILITGIIFSFMARYFKIK